MVVNSINAYNISFFGNGIRYIDGDADLYDHLLFPEEIN
jgi:hypothetical protein